MCSQDSGRCEEKLVYMGGDLQCICGEMYLHLYAFTCIRVMNSCIVYNYTVRVVLGVGGQQITNYGAHCLS